MLIQLKRRCREVFVNVWQACMTYEGLVGDVDYSYLFRPHMPFTTHTNPPPMFFGLDDPMPLLLACILGLQHAMAMMGGLASTALLIGPLLQLPDKQTEYLISACFVGAGILSAVQVARIPLWKTSYTIGTGMISVMGQTPSVVPVLSQIVPRLYDSGFCPKAVDGTKLPCPDAYGALLGTSCICGLIEVALALIPPRYLKKMFPLIVTGPVVFFIGLSLAKSGMENFSGGTSCYPDGMCNTGTDQAHPWGSGQFVGLGFSVLVTIIICDRFGPPIVKSCGVVVGLLVGCIIAASTGYFEHKSIDAAPSGEFIWVQTFNLKVYGPLVLPVLAVYLVLAMETIGDIVATGDVSRLDVNTIEFEGRIQGGVLAIGLGSILAGLMTLTPLSSYSQNNGVIAMTQCANRKAGFFCCFWLLMMGIIGKFSAAIVAIPDAVIGGMTIFLFLSITVSGLSIISKCTFTRRDRVVLTIQLMFGFSSLLVPTWFQGVFTYKGKNTGLTGFIDAIITVVQTSYAVCGLSGLLVNLLLPQQHDDNGTGGGDLEHSPVGPGVAAVPEIPMADLPPPIPNEDRPRNHMQQLVHV